MLNMPSDALICIEICDIICICIIGDHRHMYQYKKPSYQILILLDGIAKLYHVMNGFGYVWLPQGVNINFDHFKHIF